MSRFIYQVMTAFLLLLFSSENVALASILQEDSGGPAVYHHSIAQQEIPSLFTLLAEENEERGERDYELFYAEQEVQHQHHFTSADLSKRSIYRDNNLLLRAVPLYTFHCKLII